MVRVLSCGVVLCLFVRDVEVGVGVGVCVCVCVCGVLRFAAAFDEDVSKICCSTD